LTPLCRYFHYLQHTYYMQLRELNNKGAREETGASNIKKKIRSNAYPRRHRLMG